MINGKCKMSDTTKPAGTDDTVKDLLTADDTEGESDELFSDDDQKKEIKCSSDASRNVSVLSRSETPLLSFGDSSLSTSVNPSDAIVPSTPLSLLPFLNKINDQWTSDLETPQAQPCNAKAATGTAEKMEKTPKCEQSTPDIRSVDKIVSDSPVIVSRVRKCPKRRIFRTSISIDPLAVTNNEDIVVERDIKVEAPLIPENTNSVIQDDNPSIAASISSADNVFKNHESKICNKIQETCSSEESEKLKNADNLNTFTQDFFNNASFSDVDKLCSNNFDKRATNEIIENERDVEVNENIGFFTARGASINVSLKALSTAKRRFADTFDADEMQAENYELSAKKNFIEQKDKHLSLFSFVDNASSSIAKKILPKPKLQFTEQLKSYDTMHITDCRKQFVNKSPVEDAIPILFSTANGAPINISKEALSKSKALLTNGYDDNVDDVLTKKYEKSFKHRNSMKQSSMALPPLSIATDNRPISVSEKSLAKTRIVFAEHMDTAVEPTTSNKADIFDNDQYDMKASNIGFQTANGKLISISEQALCKAKILLAKHLDNPLESVTKEICNDDDELNRQNAEVSEIGFRTAHSKPINISEQALSKAKTLFTELLNDPLESDTAQVINVHNKKVKKLEEQFSNIEFQTSRNKFINISKETIARKKLFTGRLEETLEPIIAKKAKINDEINNKQEIKIPNIGFQTARGTSIDISEEARAKALFVDQFDHPSEMDILENVDHDDEEVKKCDGKIASIGFQTACGTSINISEEALSRTKTLFADQLDHPSKMDISENIERDDQIKKCKKIPSVGFQTHGTSISISKEALSKAKALFADKLNHPSEMDILGNVNHDDEVKKCDGKISNMGFQTARGTSISISEEALSRAKTLFADQFDHSSEIHISENIDHDDEKVKKCDGKISSIGFQTVRGTSISISKEALSKAKALFADQLNHPSEMDISENVDHDDEKVKKCDGKISSIGFQTTHGTSINVLKKSLSMAEALFADEFGDSSKMHISENINHDDEEVKKCNRKIPSIGFQTARGTSINISEEALSRAKTLFADHFDHPLEMNISEKVNRDDEEVRKHNVKVPHDGCEIADHQQITVPNKASLKAQELFSNDCTDANTPDNALILLQKRKLSSDENTPLSRSRMSESKKARLSNEFLARRLSFDNLTVDANNREERNKSKDSNITNKISTDDGINDECIRKIQAPCTAELSNEIVASNTKLCSDEKTRVDSITNFGLGSPERDTEQSTELDAASSPVIGRQPISRKRKSLGHRRNRHDVPADKIILNKENMRPPQENIVRRNVPCEEKADENESNAETQTERQSNNADSNEYGDTQMMMDFIDESAKILQDRLAAALEQEEAITAKRRCGSSKQLTGHLYRHKQSNSNAHLSLRQLANGAPPTPRSHQELIDQRIPPNILAIIAATAASYKFRCSEFYGSDVARGNVRGIEMEDGVRLILDENGYVGVWEFLRAFLASPGVDPNLVPARWVENHYRWIVWKLASMDRMKFGMVELPRALTPSRVMAQLKYRYDREIDRSQRPAIRRILEKDDVASKRMILCVSSIVENSNVSTEIGKSPRISVSKWKIELTDGWYSISACIDVGLAKAISIGRVREGTKLVVSGAELLNCDQGCYPLEAPVDACLKLHTNSTRRARWDTKLGYASRSGPIPIKLRNVCASGGLIGKMTIIVARVYPTLYHERTASGDSIFRNAKCEEKAQSKYEQQCWSKIETLYAKAEQDFQGDDLSCKTAGITIQLSEDYESLSTEEFVSKKQRDELMQELRLKEERFKRELQSKMRASLPAPRQVSTLLKVRVCDEDANAILAIWSPSEEVVDALKEGACVSLSNVVAAGKRGCELQLTARRSSIFKRTKMRDASYPARVCISFSEIANSKFAPPYGEFDTVGFVCFVGPAPYGMKDFEVVHLAYPEADSSGSLYLSILFWQGIATFGYAEILTVGSIVACTNLEWRRATSWNVPAAYSTDRSTFTCKPRQNYLYESFENLRNLITEPVKYAERCTFELNTELQKKPTPTRYTPGKNTPNKIYNSGSSVDKALVDYTSPLSRLGVGSSSSFTATNPSIQRRLEKLQNYGDAPELSPIVLRKSKKLSLDFKSPIRIPDATSTKDTSSTDQANNSNPSDAPQK